MTCRAKPLYRLLSSHFTDVPRDRDRDRAIPLYRSLSSHFSIQVIIKSFLYTGYYQVISLVYLVHVFLTQSCNETL
jgi:hypothetical protein